MQYPKMLYMGNTTKYQHAIANDAEHEEELLKQGFIEFDQLEVPDQGSGSVGESIPKVYTSSDALELAKVEHERNQLEAEVERLNAVIERGSAENIALKEQLAALSGLGDPVQEPEPQAQKLKTTRTKAE